MKSKIKYITPLISSMPTFALAAPQTIASFVNRIIGFINILTPILIALTIVLFFYHTGSGLFGVAKNSGEAQKELRHTLFWGVLIIFVMVSVSGILNLIAGSFDLTQSR